MTVHRLGGTTVIMDRFDAAWCLELIERHRVTHVQMVPSMFIRLLRLPEAERRRHDLSSLRVVIHAAAPCPPDVKAQMIDWLGPIVHEYYSATEIYLLTAIDSEDWLAHPGSVGRALVGVPHILDDDGRELGPGSRARSGRGRRPPSSTTTIPRRRPARATTAVGRRSATSATSTTRATSTSPTAGPT